MSSDLSIPVSQDAQDLPYHSDKSYPAGPDTSGNIFYVPLRRPRAIVGLILGLASLAFIGLLLLYTYPIIRSYFIQLRSKVTAKPATELQRRRVVLPLIRSSSRYVLERADLKAKSLDLRPPSITISYIPSSVSDVLLSPDKMKRLSPPPSIQLDPKTLLSLSEISHSPGSWASILISETKPHDKPIVPSVPRSSSGATTLLPSPAGGARDSISSFLSVPVWKMGRDARVGDPEAQNLNPKH